MKFVSTRQQVSPLQISEAILQGLAADGGLFVPESWPAVDVKESDAELSFSEFSWKILTPFFQGDPLQPKLSSICQRAFNFPLPLRSLDASTAVLELFHGPTNAFKDFGARFLALCTEEILSSRSKKKLVLVATSGDTGGAVASAFCQCTKIPVVILYPYQKVSARQEKQLTCWGDQVKAFAVRGSFDDCQRMVKQAFQSPADSFWHQNFDLISANSINIGRLLPQMAYFAYASLQFRQQYNQSAGLIIPSGNMGNSVAALWAQKLGFPIEKVIFAHNANQAVVRYFQTGQWQPQASVSTLANAMDVGNPSNFERILHLFPTLEELELKTSAYSVSDDEIRKTLSLDHLKNQIFCPHTATASHVRQRLGDGAWIIVSTAHPAKFETILEPILKAAVPIPPQLQQLLERPSKFEIIDADLASVQKHILVN